LAVILPYMNEVFIASSGISIFIGWLLIRRDRIELHKRFMIAGVILAALFFTGYLLKTVVVGDTKFGGPATWRVSYYAFLQTHSILATVGAILGIITLRYAYKKNFISHRKIGPWTVYTWFVTVITGTMVFLLLYVFYPSGPTTNLLHAWLGH